MNTSITYTLNDIPEVAKKLKQKLSDCRIITFTGPLGAGKTTLIKELLRQWGVKETITSPTFAYLNIYENTEGTKFYHFDLYRLEGLNHFLEAGFDEYLSIANSRVIIEWPEQIMPLLASGVCNVKIDYLDDSEGRKLIIS